MNNKDATNIPKGMMYMCCVPLNFKWNSEKNITFCPWREHSGNFSAFPFIIRYKEIQVLI